MKFKIAIHSEYLKCANAEKNILVPQEMLKVDFMEQFCDHPLDMGSKQPRTKKFRKTKTFISTQLVSSTQDSQIPSVYIIKHLD